MLNPSDVVTLLFRGVLILSFFTVVHITGSGRGSA